MNGKAKRRSAQDNKECCIHKGHKKNKMSKINKIAGLTQ